ncbi:MAG: 30S ribosomal protein S8 [Candidatus Liptonbacteria bacterium]|nr:30S ribosomal protein S8 [Candidatus Liptonbacteria bacterium]
MYYDLLPKIKNAVLARKASLIVPFSRMNFEVAKVLVKGKYLRDVQKKVINRHNFLEIKIAYLDNQPFLTNFKIFSKPSRHIYVNYRELRSVRNGYGLAILSTPKGILDNREAKKNKVGGEYLFEVW